MGKAVRMRKNEVTYWRTGALAHGKATTSLHLRAYVFLLYVCLHVCRCTMHRTGYVAVCMCWCAYVPSSARSVFFFRVCLCYACRNVQSSWKGLAKLLKVCRAEYKVFSCYFINKKWQASLLFIKAAVYTITTAVAFFT